MIQTVESIQIDFPITTHDDVFQGLVNDLVVIRQTVELHCLEVEKHVMALLYAVSVCMGLEAASCTTTQQ